MNQPGETTTYRAPAEEARHRCTWQCWASNPAIYQHDTAYFEDVQQIIARLASAISEHEPVYMLVGEDQSGLARELCTNRVQLVNIPTDDMWARDSGPVFLKQTDGNTATLTLNFNGWGDKIEHGIDQYVAPRLVDHLGYPPVLTDLVGEGGGIEFDGEGTLLLTDSCWLNSNRNPDWTQDAIEHELRRNLGVEKVIWLPGVRNQDDTDGHIDGAVRFVRPGVIMTSGFTDDGSDWADVLNESIGILQYETDARGRGFEITHIPAAENPRSQHPNFFTSYANFYVGNGAVYTPEFGDTFADGRAQSILSALFPGRQVVPLNVDRIYENGGGIHCVTQRTPLVAQVYDRI